MEPTLMRFAVDLAAWPLVALGLGLLAAGVLLVAVLIVGAPD